VSEVIGAMPVVWLEVDDEPSSESMRGVVERNAIALLSNYELEEAIDPPSEGWLGRFSGRPRVVRSGLWNNNHVDEAYDPACLDLLRDLVGQQRVVPSAGVPVANSRGVKFPLWSSWPAT